MDGEFAHGCILCRGKGKILITVDGHSGLPQDCASCDGAGRIDKDTFLRQLKHPFMRHLNNLEIIKLYENV